MELNKDATIRWECFNWREIESDLIQICSQDGDTVILNPKLRDIWININYETTIGELWKKNQKDLSWETFEEMINSLNKAELIRIIDEENEFDTIFG